MKVRPFIILLPFLCLAFDARAQLAQEISTSMPEQWQMSLDVIKSKAQTLMVQNNGLQSEYRQLLEQVQQLQHSIDDQQNKNEQSNRLLKERHGKTDQQVRIEALTQSLKVKTQELRSFEEQLVKLKREQVENQKFRPSQNTVQSGADDELPPLRRQLEDEKKHEVLLENELGDLKNGNDQNLNAGAIDAQNKDLEERLDILLLQKLQHIRNSSQTSQEQANARKYDELKKRKEQLEANISTYESRLDDLREHSLMSLTWPSKKKKLVHAMVEADARNNQMRDLIKVLHEDIDVLKDQVARLERRVDFVQGKS